MPTSHASVPIKPTVAPYLYMDAMRAVLALAVAFGHGWALVIRDHRAGDGLAVDIGYALAGFAHPAVMMFFALSGYWIGRSVLARADRGWSWRDYLLDRISRLGVVLVPALLLGGALDAVGLWWLHSPTHWGRTASWVLHKDVARDLSAATLLGNLLFLQGILVHPFGSNGPLWSLAAEFWYYLAFPVLWLGWRRHRAGTLAVLSLATIAIAGSGGLSVLATPVVRFFPVWLCGAALAGLEHARAIRPWSGRPPAGARECRIASAAVTAFLALLIAARIDGAAWEDWALGIGFATLLWALMLVVPRPVSGLAVLARYGAGASFSLYATHFPVVALVAGVAVGDARLAPDGRGLAVVGAAMAAAIATSLVFARLTEAQTARLRRWLSDRRTAAGAGVAGLGCVAKPVPVTETGG